MGGHHDEVFEGALERLQDLFDGSGQAMYVYMDDEFKACNERFAKLLGYRSPAEWAKVVDDIPRAFVADESVEAVIEAFQSTLNDGVAQVVPVTWRRKDGKPARSKAIFVPFDHDGHRMALHFVEPA